MQAPYAWIRSHLFNERICFTDVQNIFYFVVVVIVNIQPFKYTQLFVKFDFNIHQIPEFVRARVYLGTWIL